MSTISSDESVITGTTPHGTNLIHGLPEKRKRQRRKHKKSRVGCPQCRKRKIKCDETLPSCTRCDHRNVRCGYLDYTEKELHTVKLAHWEAEGSDPMKFPLQNSSFDIIHHNFPSQDHEQQAQLQVQILHEPQSLPEVSSFNIDDSILDELNSMNDLGEFIELNDFGNQPQDLPISNHLNSLKDNINERDILKFYFTGYIDSFPYKPSIILSPDEAVVIPPVYNGNNINDSNSQSIETSSKSLSRTNSFIIYHQTNINSITSEFLPNSDCIQDVNLNNVDRIFNSSNIGVFNIKLINHKDILPDIQMEDYPTYFNENFCEFSARTYIKRLVFTNFLYSRYHLTVFISSLLIGGYGPFLKTHPEMKRQTLEARDICINYILEESGNFINDNNAIPLLRISNVLNCSSVFLPNEVSCKQHFQFASYPATILTKIYENPLNFPKSLPAIKNYANVLFFTVKYIWVPEYNHQILYEFLNIVKEFGTKYNLSSRKSKFNKNLNTQHQNLIKFIEFSIEILENCGKVEEDLVLRYPIDRLFEWIQLWYLLAPTELFIMGPQTPKLQKILNVFWFTFIKLMESILINIRYIFCYFLDGLYLVNCFKKEEVSIGLDDKQLKWYLNYCSRIISFFERRMTYLFSNTILNDPNSSFFTLKDKLKAEALNIEERFITSFKDTVIKKIHYPVEVETKNDIVSYNNIVNESVIDLGLFEHIDDFGTSKDPQDDQVDLLTNVNPENSLLNNDYDPLNHNEPDYKKPIIFQEAFNEFFKDYIEDRQLLTRMK